MQGPSLPFSEQLHAEKYRSEGETFKECCNRIAGALEDDDTHFRGFRDILLDMRFMPGGRIQAAIGSTKNVTPFNCFVSGTIEDSFVEGHNSIMDIAAEAAATMRMGGGIGFDFSTLRPRGASIAKLQCASSGPVSFMEIFNAVCKCVASSGHRRGAQMAVLRVDHPDIEEFVRCKQPSEAAGPILEQLSKCQHGSPEWLQWYQALQSVYKLTGFNTSIAVTDEFMQAVKAGHGFKLRFGGKVHHEIGARTLWDTIMRSAWDWAEPGIIFIDTVNRMNNLAYCETIVATNPCGEQPLPPYGACLLGSFNLPRYLIDSGGRWHFDYDQLIADIPHVVRAMDNVIDKAVFPLYEQEKQIKATRRIGLGVTGLANCIEAQDCLYGSKKFVNIQEHILHTIRDHVYQASALLAKEKGAFPLYDHNKYKQSQFLKTVGSTAWRLVHEHGIRNSHLLSIAPTGTISLCADNVSSSIEPVFAIHQKRKVRMRDEALATDFEDYGSRVLGIEGVTCENVTIEEHLRVLATATRFVDSAVSKTCNVPSDTSWDDFRDLYMKAWETGCKGVTTYQVGGKRAGIIEKADQTCRIDTETGRRECD